MLQNFQYLPNLHETRRGTDSASRPVASWPIATALRAMWDAFREGLAAHREYENLRSRRMSHDRALREALGFGPCPGRRTRCTSKPLHWAGMA